MRLFVPVFVLLLIACTCAGTDPDEEDPAGSDADADTDTDADTDADTEVEVTACPAYTGIRPGGWAELEGNGATLRYDYDTDGAGGYSAGFVTDAGYGTYSLSYSGHCDAAGAWISATTVEYAYTDGSTAWSVTEYEPYLAWRADIAVGDTWTVRYEGETVSSKSSEPTVVSGEYEVEVTVASTLETAAGRLDVLEVTKMGAPAWYEAEIGYAGGVDGWELVDFGPR